MHIYYATEEAVADLQEKVKEIKEGIDLSYFVKTRQPVEIDKNGIATIEVRGMLLDNPPPIYKDLGCTDYRDISSDLKSEGIRGVLLKLDSGGGSVAGCIEVAKEIMGAGVPVVSYVDGMACSACYKIGCGADHIVARESATVGSIGTVMVWADVTKLYAAMGVTLNAITNEGATIKSAMHNGTMTEEQQEFMQERINKAGESFQNHVLANRKVDPEVFKAGAYSAVEALKLGLIDEVGSEETARARLTELIDILTQK